MLKRTKRIMMTSLAAAAAGFGAAPADAALVEEAGSPIAVGQEPWWVATGDWNGDGRPDLAVGNDESTAPNGSVSILLRQAGGGFALESTIAVGGRPDSLVGADLNGDGRTDLAVANFLSNTVTVLLRRADNAGFDAEGGPIAVGTSPHSIIAGDWNADGRMDLATPSHANGTVTVLLRTASNDGFSEEAGSPIAVGASPTQLAAADYNGDGRRDIAAANRGSDDVTILLRNATNDGFTAEAGGPPAGDAPVGLVTADFNGDGRPDLAAAAEASDDVTVLLRQAGGGFLTAPGSPHPAGDGAYGLVTADFDGDGRADLAATAFAGRRVTLLLGTGAGGFARAPFAPLPTRQGPLVPATADFDGNGRPDLAIPNHDVHTVSVRLNQPDPAPPALPPVPDGCSPPTGGRVALWRGEDGTRDSVGGPDAALERGAGYRGGVIGRAFSLAGTDDHLHVPERPALDLTGDLTLETWVQIDDVNFGNADPLGVGGDRVLFWKFNAAGTEASYSLWIEGDVPATAAPLRFQAGVLATPGSLAESAPLVWEANRWYHVAATRSGTTIRFYRDGQPIGEFPVSTTGVSTATDPLRLGGAPVGDDLVNPLVGGLDETAIWNRALGAEEVRAIVETRNGSCGRQGEQILVPMVPPQFAPPETRITSGPSDRTYERTPRFTFASDPAGLGFQCRYDGAAFQPCSAPHSPASPLTTGRHTFEVRAVNALGLVDPTPASRTFDVLGSTTITGSCTVRPSTGAFVPGELAQRACAPIPQGLLTNCAPGDFYLCAPGDCPSYFSDCNFGNTTCPEGSRCTVTITGDWNDADEKISHNFATAVAFYPDARRPSAEVGGSCETGIDGDGCRATATLTTFGDDEALADSCYSAGGSTDTTPGSPARIGPDSERFITCRATLKIESAVALDLALDNDKAEIFVPGPGNVAVNEPRPRLPLRGARAAARRTPSIRASRQRVTGPGANRLALKLTPKARKALKKQRKLRLDLTLRFTPDRGAPVSRRARITLRRPATAQRCRKGRGRKCLPRPR